MPHTIVTMTRGDAHRIAEWVEYHARLGFGDFQVVLDGERDDTATVLKSLDLPVSITLHPRSEVGEYADGFSAEERHQLALRWRERHKADLEAKRIRGRDPQSWRQHQYFSEILAPYAAGARGHGWLALLDVDEFIVLRGGYRSIRHVTHRAGAPRLRFLSFDVDTTGYDPDRPVLEQHTRRWSREELLALEDQRWANRPKSIVRYKCARLTSTLHKISTGRQLILDPERARVHHFRTPLQEGVGIPYDVDDPVNIPQQAPAPRGPRRGTPLR